VLILASAGVCVRLGVWQLDRLGDRQARNAEIEMRMNEVPLRLGAVTDGDSLAYRRVFGRGTFDFERQAVEVARPLRGIPGVYIVTPLMLADGRAILVERGWAPSPDARSVDFTSVLESDTTQVLGILIRPVGDPVEPREAWPVVVRHADPVALQSRYPYPLLPWILRRLEPPEAGLGRRLEPAPLPELSNGSHLSYAVQWFAFALIAVVGGGAAAWRARRGRSTPTAVGKPPY
jgi:surfeit locus 1 family protein